MEFRYLNSKVPDIYPLHKIQAIRRVKGREMYCNLDLKNGFSQTTSAGTSKQYAAFIIRRRRLYKGSFDLHSAPNTFRKILDTVVE